MKYKIILPNGQTIIFQRVSLRFESSSTELLVFGANEVGGQETLIGVFPYGVSLIDCTLDNDEELVKIRFDANDITLNKQIDLIQRELETHQHHLSEILKQSAKETAEIHRLKSRNLWQRILNK